MRMAFTLRAGLLATPLCIAACASMPMADSGPGARSLPRLTSGVQAELSPEQLAQRESTRELPPGDWPPLHPAGLALTKASEGWVPTLYNDAAGYCTIGYGHLIKKARCDGSEPARYKPHISQAFGSDLLVGDMTGARRAVFEAVTARISDAQHAALADFVFNVGAANFRSSTLLRKINANQFDVVPAQLRRWTRAGGKTYPGLVTRREKEIALFFSGGKIPKALPSTEDDLTPLDVVTGRPDPAN